MKPIVTYNLDDFYSIMINRGAIVMPLDHPKRSNKNAVHTSTVISKEGVNFETMNTKYVGVHNGKPKV